MKALTIIFATTFCVWLVYSIIRACPLFDLLRDAMFYISTSLCYLITYSAIQGDSPTLSLMRFIAEKRDTGRSVDEMTRFISQRPFVLARLQSLVHAGLVIDLGGTYVVAGKGSLAFRLILAYRKLYGPISKGG